MFFTQQLVAIPIIFNPHILYNKEALSHKHRTCETQEKTIEQVYTNERQKIPSPREMSLQNFENSPTPSEIPYLNGIWYGYNPNIKRHDFCEIIQEKDTNNLTFINEVKDRSKGSFLNKDTVIATEWDELIGHIRGNAIYWDNNTWWVRQLNGNLPCIFGNYCGLGCSGPGTPINPVDWCCKFHDDCYTEYNTSYPFPTCDQELVKCLKPLEGSFPLLAPIILSPFSYAIDMVPTTILKYPPWN
ncbi:hypothetical protein [Clostridium sp. HBUAS56017]|uniref:hypothetical protein n=1 Tax=Clostridium sp. HBUAS56017 TaxID=2571128 RepID=UPI001177DB45|nr:hypothetical protein [Clostridium sp. HBUAS56017]